MPQSRPFEVLRVKSRSELEATGWIPHPSFGGILRHPETSTMWNESMEIYSGRLIDWSQGIDDGPRRQFDWAPGWNWVRGMFVDVLEENERLEQQSSSGYSVQWITNPNVPPDRVYYYSNSSSSLVFSQGTGQLISLGE